MRMVYPRKVATSECSPRSCIACGLCSEASDGGCRRRARRSIGRASARNHTALTVVCVMTPHYCDCEPGC